MSEELQNESEAAQETTPCVVMLSGDLMFSSRVKAAATQAGYAFRGKLPDDESSNPIRFVILDLSTRSEMLSDIVSWCRERSPAAQLIAYGPHVQVGKLDAARQAGIPTVMTNGQFSSQMSTLFGA